MHALRAGRRVVHGYIERQKPCVQYRGDSSMHERSQGHVGIHIPDEALAQDQLLGLRKILKKIGNVDIECFCLDGDTAETERATVRERASIIFTNPDFLHASALPRHRAHARIIRNLKYLVLDEAHVYKGVFGSHVSCVLSRLHRVCLYYGATPQYVCCSATIANPLEHFYLLCPRTPQVAGPKPVLIDAELDGSPRGPRKIVMWNPPLKLSAKLARAEVVRPDPRISTVKQSAKERLRDREERMRKMSESARRSAIYEAATLLTILVSLKVKTLAFVKVRKLTELVMKYCREQLQALARRGSGGENEHHLPLAVCSYRAGYPAEKKATPGKANILWRNARGRSNECAGTRYRYWNSRRCTLAGLPGNSQLLLAAGG